MASPDFSSARSLLNWAREDTLDLKAAVEAFVDSRPYAPRVEIEPEGKYAIAKAVFADVPDDIRKIASHVVWDLRHALDHAAVAAVESVGRITDKEIHFPFSSHPNDLEYKLSSRFPDELRAVFSSFEPYPTGNGYVGGSDDLCAFSKMANVTKHAVALGAAPISNVVRFRTESVSFIRMFPNAWDGAKQELTIGHFDMTQAELQMDLDLSCGVVLSDVPAFESHDAWHVLDAIAVVVGEIIDRLDVEAAAIVAARA